MMDCAFVWWLPYPLHVCRRETNIGKRLSAVTPKNVSSSFLGVQCVHSCLLCDCTEAMLRVLRTQAMSGTCPPKLHRLLQFQTPFSDTAVELRLHGSAGVCFFPAVCFSSSAAWNEDHVKKKSRRSPEGSSLRSCRAPNPLSPGPPDSEPSLCFDPRAGFPHCVIYAPDGTFRRSS